MSQETAMEAVRTRIIAAVLVAVFRAVLSAALRNGRKFGSIIVLVC